MKRHILKLVATTALCAIGATAVPAFERTDAGKVIVFGGRQQVPIIDPHVRYDWSIRMMQQSLYDGLVKYEGDPAEIKPWLAEKWETSADGKTWTFKLNPKARFHNGDPVDAEAVRWSFERALKLNKGVAWMLKDFLDSTDIQAVDAQTVRFNLKTPYSAFLSFLPWWYIVNPKEVKAKEVDGDYGQKYLTDNAAGSGPFRIKRWEPNVLHELEAVKDYWKGWTQPAGQRPAGVIYRIIREPAAQKAALLRGEVDIVEGLTPDDYQQMRRQRGVVVPEFPGTTTFSIKMNNQVGPTTDINLRKAIAYAFDYEALVKIYNGAAKLETSPFPDAIKGYVNVPEMPRQDLAKAKEFLAKSKYPDGNLTLDFVHVAGHEESRRIGLVLLDNLAKLNIKVDIKPEQWPNMVSRGSKPETAPNMVSVFVTPISTDPDAVAYQYHPNSYGQYFAMSFFKNDEVTKLIDQARRIANWDERAKLYTQIQKMIVADQPEVFGMLQNRRWAHRDHLKGFKYSPVRFTGEVDLYPLWIDAK